MDTIRIQTERAALEIETKQAKMVIQNHRPRFKIRNKKPVMRISRKAPTFKANWAQVRSMMGSKPAIKFQRDMATRTQQEVMDNIAQIAQMGDRMMHIDRGETIPRIVRDQLMKALPDINIGLIPEQKAKLEWDLGHMKIDWEDYSFEIEWEIQQSPQIEVEPYVVEVRLRNKPTVKIWVERDEETGKLKDKFDHHI